MAGDPRKLGAGDPVLVAARDYNRWQDAGVAKARGATDTSEIIQPPDSNEGIILVKNINRDLPRFSVLGLPITGTIPNPRYDDTQLAHFQNQIALRGEVPSTTTSGRFCVLQTDARANEVVPAMLSGVTQVRINVTSITDQYADIEPSALVDQTKWLKTGGSGAAQLIYQPEILGEQWAVVRMSNKPSAQFRLVTYSHLPSGYVVSSTERRLYPKLCESSWEISSDDSHQITNERFYIVNMGDLPLYMGWAIVAPMYNDPDYGEVWGVVQVLSESPASGAQYTWFTPGTAGDWTLAATEKIILRITAGSGNVLTGTSSGDTRRWVFPYGGDVMLSHPGTYEVTFGGKLRLSATDPPFDTETTSTDSGHSHTYQLRKSLTGILAVQSNFQPGVSAIGSDSYLGTKATLYMPVMIAGEAREFEKTFVFTNNPSAWHGLGYTRLSLTLSCYDEVGHESSGTPKIVLDDAWMIVRPGQRDDSDQGFGDGVNQYPNGRDATRVWYGSSNVADSPAFITKAGAAI